MSTPLYDTLKAYAGQHTVRFHMPGHKGKTMPAPELAPLAPIDVTEIGPTGNLFEPGEPFDRAQQLWADLFGFDCCQFLTGGSTMGIHTGLTLLCEPGRRILVDRGCHRAVFNAMALLDLEPVYLQRPWLSSDNVAAHFLREDVEKALEAHPDIKTVCITSPTYSGLLSDIAGISHMIHEKGGKLFVDGAHGAHLPFLQVDHFRGADVAVVSAHKTLPAMGQSALLFASGISRDRVRRTASIYGSSSPSYPMMASMDVARQWLLDHRGDYEAAAQQVQALRQRFPSLGGGLPLDPTRLTIQVKNGPDFARRLEQRGIFAEMEDGGHVVLICTAMDSREDFARLGRALEALEQGMGDCPPVEAPPLPKRVTSIRRALFAPQETVPLRDCEGRVSACQLAPYPPGVPVVAPGEVISKKELSYFKQIGYNKKAVKVVRDTAAAP